MVQFTLEDNGVGDKTLVCIFSERLDTANCLKIENEVYEKISEAKLPVIFDLQDVDYIASSFLRMCLRASKEVGLVNFSLINVRADVKKVFKIAGFDKQINIT